MVIGLTGGIASGKSTVAGMFADLGAVVIDADKIARDVVAPGQEGLHSIVLHFGEEILDQEGRLDRKKMGEIVFSDEEARKHMNSLLHPLIRKRMEQEKQKALLLHPPLIILDIPLLYESNWQAKLEKVVVVYVPEQLQLQRLMNRNHLTQEEAEQRISAQMSIEEKKKRADFLIDNSGTMEETKEQVDLLFGQLRDG
jgi:dephospho-CoA kinase